MVGGCGRDDSNIPRMFKANQVIRADGIRYESTSWLSRIDLIADYYDCTDELLPNRLFCPDLIYERLKDGSYMVKNWKDRQSVRNMSAIDKDRAYETFYIGLRVSTFYVATTKNKSRYRRWVIVTVKL